MKTGKKILAGVIAPLIVVLLGGCEWEMSDDDDSWTDELEWADFSGTYQLSGVAGGGGSTTTRGTQVLVIGEDGGDFAAYVTQLSGRLQSYAVGGDIAPGSITMIFENASGVTVGTFTDSGGTINGTFSVADPANPEYTGTGTINYDTGRWSLNLESPGFLVAVSCSIDYTYTVGDDTVVDDSGETGDTMRSIHVTQTGNQLYCTGSDGRTYEGSVWKGSTPGGDDSGGTSGAVTMGFEISNDSGITITGTFTGTWEAPDEDDDEGVQYGTLSDKLIEATWSDGDDTMEINGVTSETTTTSVTSTDNAANGERTLVRGLALI